jgi:hypothetical protein
VTYNIYTKKREKLRTATHGDILLSYYLSTPYAARRYTMYASTLQQPFFILSFILVHVCVSAWVGRSSIAKQLRGESEMYDGERESDAERMQKKKERNCAL